MQSPANEADIDCMVILVVLKFYVLVESLYTSYAKIHQCTYRGIYTVLIITLFSLEKAVQGRRLVLMSGS